MTKKLWLLLWLPFLLSAECIDIQALYTTKYEQCSRNAHGSADELACLDAEFRRQDACLNRIYKMVRAKIQPSRRKALRDLQRRWIAYRDAKCTFFNHETSGSGGVMDVAQCLVDETIERTVELQFHTY